MQKFIFKQKVQQDIPIINTSTEEIHSLCIVFVTPRILWSVSASHSILHAFFSCAKLSSDTVMINIWHFVTQKGESCTSASGQQDYCSKCSGYGVDGRSWFPLRLHPSLLVLVHICAISGVTVPFYLCTLILVPCGLSKTRKSVGSSHLSSVRPEHEHEH